MRHLYAAALAALLALPALAQNTIQFAANTTTGNGTVTPALTWSTTPAAASCTASGASNWAGPKAASGTETLPAITSSATYNLACTWPGDSIVTFTWTNPTQNTDGSAYTDAKSVRIQYVFGATPPQGISGTTMCSSTSVPACVEVTMPATMRTVTGISQTGTLRGIAQACNQLNVCSVVSNAASKVFTGNVTVNQSVGITVNPVPGPVTTFGMQ